MSEYRQVQVLHPGSREVLFDLEQPRGVRRRMRGLIGKDAIPTADGMAFRSKQIHTFGMKIPIDAVYVSRRGTILRVSTLTPASIGPFVPRAHWILEVGAGEATRRGLVEGMKVLIERRIE
jgi:uncharacterized membrane protein (UPF0127 family)